MSSCTDRWHFEAFRSFPPAAGLSKNRGCSSPRSSGFTLLELLVSMTLVLILMVMIVQITTHTSRIWRTSMTKIQSFQEGRAGFEAMTRRIGQATLNTYWDYDPPAPAVPTKYVRQSELHFICGDAATLLQGANPAVPNVVTDAVFFQAPVGYAVSTNYTGLTNGLNACGYYVQFASDSATRPGFLNNPPANTPQRYRYRLMEMTQRTENFSLYSPAMTGNDWFLKVAGSNSRVIAENVIALVLLPKLPPSDQVNPGTPTDLTKDYSYDSHTTDPQWSITKNQLPPIMQITAVVVDEGSAIRLDRGSTPPNFGVDFTTLFKDASKYPDDLKTVTTKLDANRVTYRVFTTDVSILGAKWSSN